MVRFFRLSVALAIVLAFTSALVAAGPWIGGRGPLNSGAYLDTPFPLLPSLTWKASLGTDYANVSPSNTLLADDTLVVGFDKNLLGVTVDTGEIRWTQKLAESPVGELLYLDGQIIAAFPNGSVMAINPKDGVTIWRKTLYGSTSNTPQVADNAILLATQANTMEMIARKTGKSLASINLPANTLASPLAYGKTITLCFEHGKVLRMVNNTIIWSAQVPGLIKQTPAANNRVIIVSTDKGLYALNLASSASPIRWTYTSPGLLPDAVAINGLYAYAATSTGQLHALELQSGKDHWGTAGIVLPDGAIAQPLIIGDKVFVRMKHGLIAAYDAETGAAVWQYRLLSENGSMKDVQAGAPVVAGDHLYFAASDGTLYHFTAGIPDSDAPTFQAVLPLKAGVDFQNSKPLRYVGAVVVDEGSGLQADSVTLRLDGQDLTAQRKYDAASGYYYAELSPALTLEPGAHQLLMTAKDYRGNLGELQATFYVGNAKSSDHMTILINGQYTPTRLKVRPGTIVEWVNNSGAPRTVIADQATPGFSSDAQFPTGIPQGGRWVWVVPERMAAGTTLYYHCRLTGDAGDGTTLGSGLAGELEVVAAGRDLPGFPQSVTWPTFPGLSGN